MAFGYAGTILKVDLSEKTVERRLTAPYAEKYLAGRGINARLLFEESKPNIDAFDSRNPVIIGAGLATGSGLIGGVKIEIHSRSPEQVPQWIGNVSTGGSFGSELKYAGYDHIIITGKAAQPTYLYIEDDRVEFRDARGLWGKGVYETNRLIREDIGDPDASILAIGQAGENLVRVATIEHEYRSGTALGAVWGSKNLKAVVVRGTKGISIADPGKISDLNQEMLSGIKQYLQGQADWAEEHGLDYLKPPQYCVGVESANIFFDQTDMGSFGYYDTTEWDGLEESRFVPYLKSHIVKQMGCCPLACHALVRADAGTAVMRCFAGSMGWLLYQRNQDLSFEAAMVCSDYGIDHYIATQIAYLMKLYEKGIITATDTDGVPMEWGSGEATLHVINSVAHRRGFGNHLADGVLKFAQQLGPKAQDLLIHRRGMIPAFEDYRSDVSTALAKSVSIPVDKVTFFYEVIWERCLRESGQGDDADAALARARETYGTEKAIIPWEYELKAKGVYQDEHTWMLYDLLGICYFVTQYGAIKSRREHEVGNPVKYISPTDIELVKAITGKDIDEDQLFNYAEKANNLEKAYNHREGIGRAHDMPCDYWFDVPIPDGPMKGNKLDRSKFSAMLDEYYLYRGWNCETGLPERSTYERLGLSDVADSIGV